MKKELWGLLFSPVFAQWNTGDFGGSAICGPSTTDIVIAILLLVFLMASAIILIFFITMHFQNKTKLAQKPKHKTKKIMTYVLMGILGIVVWVLIFYPTSIFFSQACA